MGNADMSQMDRETQSTVSASRVIRDFKDSVAVVTGGGSGIGRALAEALADRGARAVIVIDRVLRSAEETAATVNETGISKATAIALDVTDADRVTEIVQHIEAEVGPIDYWFSNAGVNCGDGLGDSGDWQKAINVNLMSHVHAARSVIPRMEQRNSGGFVITASAAGLLSDMRNATYTTTKHALVGFAEWLAITVRDGISISCVCPEGVLTNMTRENSKSAGPGVSFMSAREVADRTLEKVEQGAFLVLTHDRTAEFELRRVQDRTRWINGMRKARAKSLNLNSLFPV